MNKHRYKGANILLVDDEASIRASLGGALLDEGFRVTTADSAEDALQKLEQELPDAVVLDIWLPGMDGLDLLRRAKEMAIDVEFIMMTGHGSIETAVSATKLGAFDFIEKPISLEKLLISIRNLLDRTQLARENRSLREKSVHSLEIIGNSLKVSELKEKIAKVAPTKAWVLVTGENGTGKELVAREIHALSNLNHKPLVEVNCAAIPEELIESELFGHVKGAFTGATQDRKGKFEIANEGTLFLDEIGDMSLKTQAKVLRILQEQRFERVGGSNPIQVDVRVIAATNKNLEEEIQKGTFREDLYYRLNVISFHVPALRERVEDLKILSDHFLKRIARITRQKPKTLSPNVMEVLGRYTWPGNIRELKNLIERLVILSSDLEIGLDSMPEKMLRSIEAGGTTKPEPDSEDNDIGDEDVAGFKDSGPNVPLGDGFWNAFGDSLKEAKFQFEKRFIERKLFENDGNISRTAQVIGVERSNLHRKIKTYGIDVS